MEKIILPPDLEPFRDQFEKTRRPYVKITTELDTNCSVFDSKFGGYPYLPNEVTFPLDKNQQPMCLLAQINWEEVPPLENYPQKGLTQFFTPRADDYLYGMDLNQKQRKKAKPNWQLVHYTEIIKEPKKLQIDFSFLPADQTYYDFSPFDFWTRLPKNSRGACLRLKFEKKSTPVLSRDYEFDWLINEGKEFFWSKLFTNDCRKATHC